MIASLRARWRIEREVWHLRPWQLVGLLLLSAWPWVMGAAFPDSQWVAMAPVIVFMPLAYLGGSALHALVPDLPVAYPLGASLTIFFFAYLLVVSWR